MARLSKLVVPKLPGDRVIDLSIRILESTLRRLRVEAIERDLNVSDLIAEALACRPHNPIYPDTALEKEMRLRSSSPLPADKRTAK